MTPRICNMKLKKNSDYIADYDYVKIFQFFCVGIKLWLKEDDDLHTNHFQYPFKFIHSKAQNLCKTLCSFSHNFTCSIAKLGSFTGKSGQSVSRIF